MKRSWMVLATVALVAWSGIGLAASDPVAKCAASKVQSTGKKASSKLKCHSKAVGKAVAVDPLCLGKAETKFSEAFSKAESKGGCATVGDAPALEALVDDFVADVVGALPSGGTKAGQKCAAGKIKEAGKKADAKLKCHSKAIGKSVDVDPGCLQKAEDKFLKAFGKAETKGGCATSGDAATLEARVDQLVAAVLGGSPSTSSTTTTSLPTPTTSSTSTTTSTTTATPTTTSTTVPSGNLCVGGAPNGTPQAGEQCDDGDDVNTNGCTNDCRAARCGDGITFDGVEQCDIPGQPLLCRSDCTWTPAVCGDGTRQFGETCDDGNTVDGDACPSSCVINTCAGTQTRVQATVSYAKQTSVSVGNITTFLDYPDGRVTIPGVGGAASVGNRITAIIPPVPAGYGDTDNDLDYAVNVLLTKVPPLSVLVPGQLYTVSFDLCLNQTAPPASAFTCRVTAAVDTSNNDINLATNPMSCSVTIP